MRYDGQNGHNVDVKRRGARLALPAVSMSSKKLTRMLQIQTTSTRESCGPQSFTVTIPRTLTRQRSCTTTQKPVQPWQITLHHVPEVAIGEVLATVFANY